MSVLIRVFFHVALLSMRLLNLRVKHLGWLYPSCGINPHTTERHRGVGVNFSERHCVSQNNVTDLQQSVKYDSEEMNIFNEISPRPSPMVDPTWRLCGSETFLQPHLLVILVLQGVSSLHPQPDPEVYKELRAHQTSVSQSSGH